jgi:hypothetical protein
MRGEKNVFKSKLVVLGFLWSTLSLNSVGFAAVADGWAVKQITNGTYIELDSHQISETNVIWVQNNQIMFWDGIASTQISSGYYCCNPQISGVNIVWSEVISQRSQIMFWNGTVPTQISIGGNDCYYPQISGTNVVWVEHIGEKNQVMFCDGSTVRQISSGDNQCFYPHISGVNVVWYENTNNGPQIMFWNGSTPVQISSGNIGCFGPQISGTNVMWREQTDSIPSKNLIMFWDGGVVKQISTKNDESWPPQESYWEPTHISGSNIVWSEKDINGNLQIMFWNGSTVTQLTHNQKGKGRFSISGTNVVWEERPEQYNIITLIYFWDGNSVTKLADLAITEVAGSSISGSNVIWVAYDANYDFQIFLAQPGTIPPTQPFQGDINKDNIVNFKDLAILGNDWLKRTQ